MRDAALLPLQTVKKRFYSFIEELSRIWADFWVSYYGIRQLKINGKNGNSYIHFDGNRYKGLLISTKVDVANVTAYSDKECLETLITLFEKGIIDRNQLLSRIPKGIVPDIKGLLTTESEVLTDERS